MRFIFPHSMAHLPNEGQLRLLFELTLNTDFPGFLHESALAVSKNRKVDGQYIPYNITPSEIAYALRGSEYLYISYDTPKSYIMTTDSDVMGFVHSGTLLTYWFETPISLYEIYTAEHYEIPIVCKFVHIGRSDNCKMCNAVGALDWVDEAKATQMYRPVPKKRFVIATHRYHNYLIDNKNILEYKGEHLIQPCPKCMGLGCEGVLHMADDKIVNMNFTENPMYHLIFRGARETLIETPYPFT